MDEEKITTNSKGQIVSGSRVRVPGNTIIFDVGEVNNEKACLYLNGQKIKEMPIKELQAM